MKISKNQYDAETAALNEIMKAIGKHVQSLTVVQIAGILEVLKQTLLTSADKIPVRNGDKLQ